MDGRATIFCLFLTTYTPFAILQDLKLQLLFIISTLVILNPIDDPFPAQWMWIFMTKFGCPFLDGIALDQTRAPSSESLQYSLLHPPGNRPHPITDCHLGTKDPLPYSEMRLTLWHNLCSRASLWEQTEARLKRDQTLAELFSSVLCHFPLSPSPESVLPVSLLNKNPSYALLLGNPS